MIDITALNRTTKERFLLSMRRRSTQGYPAEEEAVRRIIDDVLKNGDEALFNYALQYDGCVLTPDNLRITKEQIKDAYRLLDPVLVDVMKESADNIRRFHEKQRRTGFDDTSREGIRLGQRITPLEIAGVYVPGGKAAYPSSVLMNVIPASVAGVTRILMTTPASGKAESEGTVAGVSAATIVAADIAGVTEILRVGGAHAIAAMAFGTASVPRVDKITGPGNIYVALAKKAVFGHVSIDSIAGPSEVLVLADDTADARFVAADMMAQAEHDEKASAILITTSMRLAKDVQKELTVQIEGLSRKEIISKSLNDYGAIFVAETMEEAIGCANEIASEHLEILTADPEKTMEEVRHAGAVFLGPYSPEPLGDYYAGPNHILPTNRTARFFSALGVDDFIKKTSVIRYEKEQLLAASDRIIRFADEEGLTAHARAIALRAEES